MCKRYTGFTDCKAGAHRWNVAPKSVIRPCERNTKRGLGQCYPLTDVQRRMVERDNVDECTICANQKILIGCYQEWQAAAQHDKGKQLQEISKRGRNITSKELHLTRELRISHHYGDQAQISRFTRKLEKAQRERDDLAAQRAQILRDAPPQREEVSEEELNRQWEANVQAELQASGVGEGQSEVSTMEPSEHQNFWRVVHQ